MRIITGYGIPTSNTIGEIDDIYIDNNTECYYICTSIYPKDGQLVGLVTTKYVWEPVTNINKKVILSLMMDEIAHQTSFNTVDSSSPSFIIDPPCRRFLDGEWIMENPGPGIQVLADLSSYNINMVKNTLGRDITLDSTSSYEVRMSYVYNGVTMNVNSTASTMKMIDSINYSVTINNSLPTAYIIIDPSSLTGDYIGKFPIVGIYIDMINDNNVGKTKNFKVWTYKYVKLADKYLPSKLLNDVENCVKNNDKQIILTSSTEGSTKKFQITVDDSGTLTATETT